MERRRKILVVTKNVPWPPNSGEKQRTVGVVRALRSLGDVTVVGFVGPHDDPTQAADEGVRVRGVPQRNIGGAQLLSRSAALGSITAAKWWSSDMCSVVSEELDAGCELAVAEHVQLARYLTRAPLPNTVTVLDMHNVESLLTARLARTTKTWHRVPLMIESRALRRLERRAAPSFDLVGVVSEPDRVALRNVVDHPHVVVVPNAYDGPPEGLHPATEPTACFVGLLSWAPNADAAVAFTQHVWPRVRRSVPGATLLLVGRDPTPSVQALASDDVIVTGTVEDLDPWYARTRVALAPLLAGGGSRLKILEALSRGRPVLATTVGAEGLEDLVGQGVVVADQPDAMAEVLTQLLLDPAMSETLGERGARAVRDHHSWSAASSGLVKDIEVLLDKQ